MKFLNPIEAKETAAASNPTYSEGMVFYDKTKKALSYYNDESDVTVNLGQELLVRVYNNTGSTIPNGSVVYSTGSNGEVPTIGLANASLVSKSRGVIMTTHDIENNSYGYGTRFGAVGGINTSSFSVGSIVYLSDTVDGGLTTTIPSGGSFLVRIGTVTVSDVSGTIVVNPNFSELTVEVTDTNGFPESQRTATTISFNEGTRVFTIAPTGTKFYYYMNGLKYESFTSKTVTLPNTTGLYLIYFDAATLTYIANPTPAQVSDIIKTKCSVSYILWNATVSQSILMNDERHGISMSPSTHDYLHFTKGCQYLYGITPSDINIGDGSLNSGAQFGTTSGAITDEDLYHILSSVTSTTGYRYYYRYGATAELRKGTNSGYAFPMGASLPQYNRWTGTAWELAELTSGSYMSVHLFANGDISKVPVAIVGLAQYAKISEATAGAPNEISDIMSSDLAPEYTPIATFLLEGKISFTNAVKARYILNNNGDQYYDWRTSELRGGAGASSHNALADLQLAATTITWGHIDDQAQTIAGVKTFSSFPVTPSSAPTTDYEVANKKYIDDNFSLATHTHPLATTSAAGFMPTTDKDKIDSLEIIDTRLVVDGNPVLTADDSFEFTGTLPNTSWTGTEAPFTKVVTVSGVLAAGKTPIISVVLSETWATAITESEAWAHIKRIAYTDDTLTFYADEVPSVSLNFIGQQDKSAEGLGNPSLSEVIVVNNDAAPALGTLLTRKEYRCTNTSLTTAPSMTIASIASTLVELVCTVIFKAPNATAPVITNNSGYTLKYIGQDVVSGTWTPVANTVYHISIVFDGIYVNVYITGVI